MNKVVLVLIAVVLLGIAGFATLWFRAGSTLQQLAEDLLVASREGQRERVYGEATEAFRTRWTLPQFEDYLEYWHERLGAFRSVRSRLHASASSYKGGTWKSVTLALEYEKGAAEGRFDFVENEQGPRLTHFSLCAAASDELQGRAALVVPSEALLRRFGAGEFTALYAALSADLQWSSGYKAFRQIVSSRREALGRLVSTTVRGTAAETDDTVTYLFDLVGERGKGTARIGWFKTRSRWEVVELTFDLVP